MSATFIGTIGTDLKNMIKSLKTGIKYEAKSDEHQPRYGWVDVQIGTVSKFMLYLLIYWVRSDKIIYKNIFILYYEVKKKFRLFLKN